MGRRLLAAMDAGLNDALAVARPLVQDEDGRPAITQEGELTLRLPPDLTLLLLDRHGRPVDRVGRDPGMTPGFREGCFDASGWRVCAASVPYGKLLALKPRQGLEQSVASLDRVLGLLFPGVIPVAFGLGYLLGGRALAPLRRMTHEAYALVQRRACRKQLPEPRSRDEVWRLARATNTLLAALAEIIENERRFTQNAAHELRTPLTVLGGAWNGRWRQVASTKSGKPWRPPTRCCNGWRSCLPWPGRKRVRVCAWSPWRWMRWWSRPSRN